MWVVVVSICTSLIIVLVISGSMGRGLLSMGKQSIRKTCRCPATRCCKQPELFGWDPPPPPVNEHNRFQYTVPSHIKVVRLIRAGRGVRGKKSFFVTEGIWQRKPRFIQIQWASPLCMVVECAKNCILRTMPVSNQLRNLTCGTSRKSFAGHRIWICILGP